MLTAQASKRINKLLENYIIISAIIDSKDRIILVTKHLGGEDDYSLQRHELATDVILYNPEFNEKGHGVTCRSWSEGISAAWGAFTGDSGCPTIFCSNYNTIEFTSDEQWTGATGWEDIPRTSDSMFRGIFGIKNIDGDVYITGFFRKVYKRVGQQQWEDITSEEQHPNLHADVAKIIKKKERFYSVGFLAVDGFNKNDIYAGGEGSDLWHYDGKAWVRLSLPTYFNIRVILCAPDSYVYIAGDGGTILKGKYDAGNEEDWEILKSPISYEKIMSLAWFKGLVYVADSYGLYTIDAKGKAKEYEFPADGIVQRDFSNVASCDEALLSYGTGKAFIFDGTEWKQLVGNVAI